MTDSLDAHELQDWLGLLLSRLTPAQLRKVNRSVAYTLRRAQSDRIAQQKNPDGSTYAPRTQMRAKKGHIRRKKMFVKLRTLRHLKISVSDSEMLVGFTGRSALIASRHQYGSKHRFRGHTFVTPARGLLGFADQDLAALIDAYLGHLAGDQIGS